MTTQPFTWWLEFIRLLGTYLRANWWKEIAAIFFWTLTGFIAFSAFSTVLSGRSLWFNLTYALLFALFVQVFARK